MVWALSQMVSTLAWLMSHMIRMVIRMIYVVLNMVRVVSNLVLKESQMRYFKHHKKHPPPLQTLIIIFKDKVYLKMEAEHVCS